MVQKICYGQRERKIPKSLWGEPKGLEVSIKKEAYGPKRVYIWTVPNGTMSPKIKENTLKQEPIAVPANSYLNNSISYNRKAESKRWWREEETEFYSTLGSIASSIGLSTSGLG